MEDTAEHTEKGTEESSTDTKDIEQASVAVVEREPTMRQALLADKLMENYGSAKSAMLAVGYSEASAKNPALILKGKSFRELMEKKAPDKYLLKKHREFLDSKKIIRVYIKGDLKEETEETDSNAVKSLDMFYKLKGHYADKQGNNTLIINVSASSRDRYKPADERKEDETIDVSAHGN